jgi:hypothetical protein
MHWHATFVGPFGALRSSRRAAAFRGLNGIRVAYMESVRFITPAARSLLPCPRRLWRFSCSANESIIGSSATWRIRAKPHASTDLDANDKTKATYDHFR